MWSACRYNACEALYIQARIYRGVKVCAVAVDGAFHRLIAIVRAAIGGLADKRGLLPE